MHLKNKKRKKGEKIILKNHIKKNGLNKFK